MKHVDVRWTVLSVFALGAAALGPRSLEAQTTRILVRVTAHDAKIIGSGVGGARVTVRDATSGDVLAEGLQEGSTGSTELIMGPRPRGETVYDTDGAAAYVAELDIREPTRVLIEAEGPLGTREAVQRAAKTLLVLPGVDLVGEGVVLELNGFTVELIGPVEGAEIEAGKPFDIRARVTMLCGCPTEPGGLWDSSAYRITARALRGGEVVGEWPMEFAGTTSEYTVSATVDAPGELDLQVIALDPAKANTGMATGSVVVR
jgi:hypothetical protein